MPVDNLQQIVYFYACKPARVRLLTGNQWQKEDATTKFARQKLKTPSTQTLDPILDGGKLNQVNLQNVLGV